MKNTPTLAETVADALYEAGHFDAIESRETVIRTIDAALTAHHAAVIDDLDAVVERHRGPRSTHDHYIPPPQPPREE